LRNTWYTPREESVSAFTAHPAIARRSSGKSVSSLVSRLRRHHACLIDESVCLLKLRLG